MFGWIRRRLGWFGRSGRWPTVRLRHLDREPVCQACGRNKDLEVHHVLPFATYPEHELDPANLITLCASPCHLVFGHLMNYQRYNPMVRHDAAIYRQRMLTCGVEAAE